ncbi:P-loop containing nucleoside triphosphate hydrolase [Sesbania bispinosa]|nr:P-loop containing nucleoside triphosphate hydrolase [Sesbania bispinosa]
MEPLSWSWKFLRSSERLKAWLEQQHYHLKSFEARDNELKEAIKKLENERDRVQNKVVEETERYGRGIPDEIKGWINEVNEIFSEYRKFYGDKRRRTLARCVHGYLPKHGIRYRLSREAFDLKEKVNKLLERAKFDAFSYWLGPPSMTAIFHNVGYVPFTSRDEIVNKINAALEDPSVRMIGLHGWSGVGKTTLVKEIARKASEAKAKMFHVAVMANVTRNPDIRKIQGQIADKLGIKLEEESDNARAARIRERLKNEKESTLIILDDLWAALDFNLLGIPLQSDAHDNGERSSTETTPGVEEHSSAKTTKKIPSENVKGKAITMKKNPSENDEGKGETRGEQIMTTIEKHPSAINTTESEKVPSSSSSNKGCKVLLISESKQVLLSLMEGKENSIYSLGVLKEREAETLFKKKAGVSVSENFEFEKLATQIASKCNGLPTTIITTARALKNQSRSVWEDVHQRLENKTLIAASEFSTKLSYELLENEELKDTFLLCARLGQDALIMDLVKYCIGLGFLEGIYTVREARSRVYALVGRLKVSGLLSYSYPSDHFTMSDIVRSAALSIASKEKHVFTMIKGKVDEWPDKEKLERCLTKLRMLCLEQCKLGEELSIIGALKNVRILSLSGSDIEKLPVELKHLTMLQILDLSNCFKLREIPPKVISSLTSLAELYMRSTIIPWKVEEQTKQSENASLSELRHLNQLTTLDIQIRDVSYLPNNLFFDKLSNYSIIVGDLSEYLEMDFKIPEKYEESRFLAIQSNKGFDIHSQKGIKMLFETVENLFLEELEDVQDLFYGLNLKGFPCLKHLLIVNNSKIQSLIKPEERRDRENRQDRKNQENTFHKLESLYLCNLKVMDNICSCNLSAPCFGELRVIKINLCGQLKKVFSFSVARLLTVLETIEVSECKALTEIVSMEEEEQSGTNEAEHLFPELRSLTLQSLSEFIGLYPISSTEGEATILFDGKVLVSKLERMVLSSIQIGEIWSKSLETGFKSLIHLDVNGCGNLEYLISFSMAKCLDNLQSLFVSECVRMSHIFSQGEDSFGKLDTVIIEECGKLVNVFRCYKKGIFQSLCNLRVTNCRSMTEVFDLGDKTPNDGDVINLQHVHLETLPKLKHIWKWNEDQDGMLKLNNLQKILVLDCDSLENIFPVSVARCLHSLEFLVVSDCVGLREIVGEGATSSPDPTTFEFRKLTTIKISELPELESFYRGAYELKCPELKDLSIENCARLEPFRKEIFTEEVINKLKTMRIESWHAKSSSSYMGEWNPRRENLEELSLSGLMSTELLYSFLHTHPNLKTLSLHNSSLTEIVPLKMTPVNEKYAVVPKLKSLKLGNLPNLETIGFERDMVLQRIEFLILKNCPCLVDIIPSSVSLTHLTILEVVNCNGLEKLMSPSAAKSLGQLNTMKAIKCESLEEIVGNEDENNGEVDIAFRQLKTLELVSLKNLNSFCSSKSCAFEFPSLEKLVVSACPKMENFSEGVKSTPSLQNIHVFAHEQGMRSRCWKGNLKATVEEIFKEKKFFEGMDEINVYEHPELQAWHDKVGLLNRWFYSLKTLKLYKCTTHQYAIPSNILPNLKSLNELEVRNCNLVKVIFDMNGTENMETSQLKNLTLEGLLELKHVWDKNHQGISTFQNLQQLSVGDCKNLQSLFPAALAKKLEKLEKLEIKSCHELPEIVGKKEKAALIMTEEFVFPCLTSLYLYDLKRLTCFYPETFTLELPLLNNLFVLDCHKLELFQSADLEAEGEGNRQPLFSDIEVISNLEKLVLDWKHISGLRSRQLTNYLKHLDEFRMYFDVDENEKPTLPWEILKKASNLREMTIEYCKSLEMFHTQDTNISEQQMPANLKMLLPSLIQVDIWQCPEMEIFSQGLIKAESFRGIQASSDSNDELIFHVNLNSSVQRVFMLQKFPNDLNEMSFSEHPEPQEAWQVGVQNNWFYILKTLKLYQCRTRPSAIPSNILPCLKSLNELEVQKCNHIEAIFNLERLEIDWKHISGLRSRQLINDFKHLNVFCMYFDVDENEKPTLPSEILEKAPNLREMTIEYCKTLEIFRTENPKISERKMLAHLKNLKLRKVSQLQSIGSEGSSWFKTVCENLHQLCVLSCPDMTTLVHSAVSFSYLKHLYIYKCQEMKCLFTTSAARGLMHLAKIQVEQCDQMKEIMAKDQDETTSRGIEFEWLDWIDLTSLSSLECFYSGHDTLLLPSLTQVDISQCPKMNIFSRGSIKAESFKGIQASSDSKDDLFYNNDINASVETVFLLNQARTSSE